MGGGLGWRLILVKGGNNYGADIVLSRWYNKDECLTFVTELLWKTRLLCVILWLVLVLPTRPTLGVTVLGAIRRQICSCVQEKDLNELILLKLLKIVPALFRSIAEPLSCFDEAETKLRGFYAGKGLCGYVGVPLLHTHTNTHFPFKSQNISKLYSKLCFVPKYSEFSLANGKDWKIIYLVCTCYSISCFSKGTDLERMLVWRVFSATKIIYEYIYVYIYSAWQTSTKRSIMGILITLKLQCFLLKFTTLCVFSCVLNSKAF